MELGIGCKAPWWCNPIDGSGSSTDLEDNCAQHFPWVNQSPCSDRALYHSTSTNSLSLINKNLFHTPSCIHIYILIQTTKLIQSQNQVALVEYQSAKYRLPWRSYWNSPCTYLRGMWTLQQGQELLPPLSEPSGSLELPGMAMIGCDFGWSSWLRLSESLSWLLVSCTLSLDKLEGNKCSEGVLWWLLVRFLLLLMLLLLIWLDSSIRNGMGDWELAPPLLPCPWTLPHPIPLPCPLPCPWPLLTACRAAFSATFAALSLAFHSFSAN